MRERVCERHGSKTSRLRGLLVRMEKAAPPFPAGPGGGDERMQLPMECFYVQDGIHAMGVSRGTGIRPVAALPSALTARSAGSHISE